MSIDYGKISKFDESAGTLIYSPDKKFTGNDKFTFKAIDSKGAASNVATVSIDVANKPPKASAQGTGSATAELQGVTREGTIGLPNPFG
jgi:hypothetical protein